MRLEQGMWDALNEICAREGMSVHSLCTVIKNKIDADQAETPPSGEITLTSAIRAFALRYFREAEAIAIPENGIRQGKDHLESSDPCAG